MAADKTKTDAKLVRQPAEDLVPKDLHIVDSENCLKMWKVLLDGCSVGRTLERLTALYRILHKREVKKLLTGRSLQTFKFFADIKTINPHTDIGQSIIENNDDLTIYNLLLALPERLPITHDSTVNSDTRFVQMEFFWNFLGMIYHMMRLRMAKYVHAIELCKCAVAHVWVIDFWLHTVLV